MKSGLTNRIFVVITAVMLIFAFSACSDSSSPTGDGGNNTAPASLTWDDFAGPIFQSAASCASSSCHGGSAPQNSFSVASYATVLTGGNAGAGIVPNDTASSIAYRRLTGAIIPRMPFNQTPLAQSTLDSLAMWIMAGAPESPVTN